MIMVLFICEKQKSEAMVQLKNFLTPDLKNKFDINL
jgi:hypothetical protein